MVVKGAFKVTPAFWALVMRFKKSGFRVLEDDGVTYSEEGGG
jgi:hypothetical protein